MNDTYIVTCTTRFLSRQKWRIIGARREADESRRKTGTAATEQKKNWHGSD